MACVDRVAKNGTNASQGYKYAQAADVYDAVRGELAKRFILPVPRNESVEFVDVPTKAGGTLKLCTVRGFIDFTDAESGEVLPVKCFGQGSDSGDKSGYKAVTGATKQCLVQLFLIPTGDDPESERAERRKPPPPAGLDAVKAGMHGQRSHAEIVMGKFGDAPGKKLSELTDGEVKFYRGACRRTLDDPTKTQWHASETQRLASFDAELRFRGIAS